MKTVDLNRHAIQPKATSEEKFASKTLRKILPLLNLLPRFQEASGDDLSRLIAIGSELSHYRATLGDSGASKATLANQAQFILEDEGLSQAMRALFGFSEETVEAMTRFQKAEVFAGIKGQVEAARAVRID